MQPPRQSGIVLPLVAPLIMLSNLRLEKTQWMVPLCSLLREHFTLTLILKALISALYSQHEYNVLFLLRAAVDLNLQGPFTVLKENNVCFPDPTTWLWKYVPPDIKTTCWYNI